MWSLLAVAAADIPREPAPLPFHFESFSTSNYTERWQSSPVVNVTGTWDLRETLTPQGFPGEQMIFGAGVPAHFGLSTEFPEPLDVTNKTLVLQYEVRYSGAVDCAGAYIKLFGKDNFSPKELCNETRYIIMFGPDKCAETDKVHFIFRHQNQLSGLFEEKHMTDAPTTKNDTIAHLYTLIVRPDNSFEILIDANSAKKGNLLTDFSPSVAGPLEISDPDDRKPADWDDEPEIDDPNAERPADWDDSQPQYIPDPDRLEPPEDWFVHEPKFIPDPSAVQPDSWDPDIHGDWEPPTIPNPKCEEAAGCGEYEPPLIDNDKYQGKWYPPKIANPAYKGTWSPRKIPNPYHHVDPHPHNFPPLIGAGFELWMISSTIGFGNVYIGTDEAAVRAWNKAHFIPKFTLQEEYRKKNEPTPTPIATPSASAWNYRDQNEFGVALNGFLDGAKDSILLLFDQSRLAGVIVSVILVGVPLLLCLVSCRSPQPRPVAVRPKLSPEEREKRRKAREEARRKKEAEAADGEPPK